MYRNGNYLEFNLLKCLMIRKILNKTIRLKSKKLNILPKIFPSFKGRPSTEQ